MSVDVATSYARHLRARGLSPRTVRLRLHQLDRLQGLVGDLLAVDEERLVGVLDGLYDTHAAETRKSIRTSMRVFYAWAHRAGLVDADPAAYLPPIRIPHALPKVAPDADIVAALVGATMRERYMVLAARYGCLRLAELSALHPRDRTGERLRILGKGGKQRIVFAHPDLLEVLVELEREQGTDAHYLPERYIHLGDEALRAVGHATTLAGAS